MFPVFIKLITLFSSSFTYKQMSFQFGCAELGQIESLNLLRKLTWFYNVYRQEQPRSERRILWNMWKYVECVKTLVWKLFSKKLCASSVWMCRQFGSRVLTRMSVLSMPKWRPFKICGECTIVVILCRWHEWWREAHVHEIKSSIFIQSHIKGNKAVGLCQIYCDKT